MHRDRRSDPSGRVVLHDGFPGTADGVRTALERLRRELEGLGASDEEAFSAELVVAEALNNVVEHALRDAEDPRFDFCLCQAARGLLVAITDRGHPMPDGMPPLGANPEIPAAVEDLPEGGFGWFLIRELARDLTYARRGGENRLTFRLALCEAEAA